MRTLLCLSVCTLIWLFLCSPCFAAGASDLASERKSEWETRQDSAEQALRSTPMDQWTDVQKEAWCFSTLQTVYWALSEFVLSEGRHPTDMSALTSGCYLTEELENPFNNWEPLELRYDDTSFHAGDLYVQVAPYESYVSFQQNRKARITFTIGIFGPSQNFSPSRGPVLFNDKFGLLTWSPVPSGTAFMTAMRRNSVEERDAKRAAALKAADEGGN